jgi:hypothetical protein
MNTGIAVHVSPLKWFKNEQKSLQAKQAFVLHFPKILINHHPKIRFR